MVSNLRIPTRLRKSVVLLWIVALALVLIPVSAAKAAAVVNNCGVSNASPVPGNLIYGLNQGGTVKIMCSGTLVLPAAFTVDKNITLDGTGQNVIISGQSAHQIFYVKPGAILTIKNVTLIDGVGHHGGAIHNAGKLVVDSATFKNNRGKVGGAIYSYYGGTVTVTDSTFINNVSPVGVDGTNYYGGAIYMEDGSLNVLSSHFNNNEANNGGAIFNNKGSLTVRFSDFTDNTARLTNPKIYHSDDGSENYTTNSEDEVNGALGGAIYSGTPVNIDHSHFTNNTAYHEGGAIFTLGGQLTGNTFETNKTVGGNGGAILNSGTLQTSSDDFRSNQAHYGEGGAIFNTYGSVLTLFQSDLRYNISNHSGGGISSYGNYVEINSSFFLSNYASAQGGAVEVGLGMVKVVNSTFDNNVATTGATLHAGKYSQAIFTNATVSSGVTPNNSVVENDGKVTFQNTIVSNYNGTGNCTGKPVVDGGNNLQFPNQGCSASIPVKDPLLIGEVYDSGNSVTMALGAGSPAIDNGNDSICNASPVNGRDQRGFSRSVDGDKNGVARCDIGAFEYGSTQPIK